MFLKTLEITPTSALTFRRVPMSHKIIDSYNFVPPTTLSGFLYRLIKLSSKEALPTPKKFKTDEPQIDEYHILETKEETKGALSLGGYPVDSKSSTTFMSFRMGYQHLGKGHSLADGIDIFDPSLEDVTALISKKINEGKLKEDGLEKFQKEFEKSGNNKYYKRCVFKAVLNGLDIPTFQAFKKEERRQPLDWYFCSAEKFYGFLISEEPDSLDLFDRVENYGFKIGKEGFAYVSRSFKTLELEGADGEFVSSTIIPTTDSGVKLKELSEIESLYYFDPDAQRFGKGIFALNGTLAEGEYYTVSSNNVDVSIPQATVKLLKGA